jgi:hypothetical protein
MHNRDNPGPLRGGHGSCTNSLVFCSFRFLRTRSIWRTRRESTRLARYAMASTAKVERPRAHRSPKPCHDAVTPAAECGVTLNRPRSHHRSSGVVMSLDPWRATGGAARSRSRDSRSEPCLLHRHPRGLTGNATAVRGRAVQRHRSTGPHPGTGPIAHAGVPRIPLPLPSSASRPGHRHLPR